MAKPEASTGLDPGTARLARDWSAEARARTEAEEAAERSRKRPPAGDGLFDWLFGDPDGGGGDAGA